MFQKFRNHIYENLPFLLKSRFFIAVSGGIDSMVLVHLFQKLGCSFSLLHCNFQLRGEESDGDANFVSDFAKAHNIPCEIIRFDTKEFAKQEKVSIQIAARNLRYDWFESQLQEHEFEYVLTAHHADDNLETFLINLSRGTGLEGLTGIPKQNNHIVRPLLPFSRIEIEDYAEENNIKWREDSSNASDKYLRNKIRHKIVPVLKELNPGLTESFNETLRFLKQSKSMADDASKLILNEVSVNVGTAIHFNINKLIQYDNYEAYLYDWLKSYGFTAWKDIKELVYGQTGKQVFAPDFILLKNRDSLILMPKSDSKNDIYLIMNEQNLVLNPITISLTNVTNVTETLNNETIFVDKDKLKFPLVLRKWVEGDYFYPFGMVGKKKLSKYFKDEKFSLIDKQNCWLLCSDNEVFWIIGKRADRRFLANQTTKTILKLQLDNEKN